MSTEAKAGSCLIVTSRIDSADRLHITPTAYDAIICADKGL